MRFGAGTGFSETNKRNRFRVLGKPLDRNEKNLVIACGKFLVEPPQGTLGEKGQILCRSIERDKA